jgi:hypothetical protein
LGFTVEGSGFGGVMTPQIREITTGIPKEPSSLNPNPIEKEQLWIFFTAIHLNKLTTLEFQL